MKHRLVWAGACALAVSLTSPTETKATNFTNANGVVITNGVIFVTTRSASDAWFYSQSSSTIWDGDDPRGPGAYSPGDAKMCELLQDHGYSTRLIAEKPLSFLGKNVAGPTYYRDYFPGCSPDFIVSGSTTDPYSYY